jgi:glycosyltransferase involved in cell wall biosynthesis
MIYFVNRFFAPDESATAQMLTQLVGELRAREFAVTVLASRMRHDAEQERLVPLDDLLGATVIRIASTRFGRARLLGRLIDYLSFYMSAFFAMLWRLKKGDTLVALTDPPMLGTVLHMAASLKGAQTVHWLQDIFPEVASALLPKARLNWLFAMLRGARNFSLRRSAHMVVLGSRMRERVQALKVAPERISEIENWADGTLIMPTAPADNPLYQQWQHLPIADSAAPLIVGYSGNLGRAHEFETIVQAMVQFRGDRRVRFLFIGQGAQLNSLKQRVLELGLAEQVDFKPFQPASMLRYSLSVPDLHFVTLQHELEGLIVPSKLYGAMAAGRPVLFIGDVDGEVARTLKKFACGAAAGVNDVAAVVAAIERYRDDPELLAREQVAARAAFESNFSKTAGGERWASLLRSLNSESGLPIAK